MNQILENQLNIEDKFEEIVKIAPVRPEEAYALCRDLLFQCDNNCNYLERAIIQAATAFSGQFLGYYTEAFNLANEALIIFEEKQNLKYQAFVYNTLGFIYNYLNDLDNRLEVNLKSLQLRKTIGDTDGYMRSLNNTGDTYCRLGAYSKAIDYFNSCLEITPKDNLRMLAVVTCNLGEAYFFIDDIEKSKLFLGKSEDYVREIEFQGLLPTICLYKAKIKISEGDYTSAIAMLKGETEKIDMDKYPDDAAPLFKELGICYEKIENATGALSNYKIFYALQERMNSEKYDSEIRRIQFSYEINNLQNQKNQLEALVYERTVELESAFTALQTKDKTNEAILESATDGVVLINIEGKIQKANRIFWEKLSIQENDDLDQFIFEYLEFEDGSEFKNFIAKLFSDSDQVVNKNFLLRTRNKLSSPLFFKANYNLIHQLNEYLGLIFLNDVTFQLQIEDERREELEAEKTINIFAQSLFNENTVDGVLWSLTKNCIAHLGFYECVVYLVDNDQQFLIQKAAHGPKNPSERQIFNPIKIEIGKGIVGTVASSGRHEKIGNTSLDSRYIIDDEVRLSEIAVPIFSHNQVVGVIDSEHPDINFFTDRHLRILTTVSQLVANRIDKLSEQEAKEKLQVELIQLNANLENEVRNKTKENTELARLVFEQEQKAIFGELTKSVAHELNTPMAIIKSGVEAIINQIGEACNGFTSTELTRSDLEFVRKTVLIGKIPIHRFGLEESKKIREIEDVIQDYFKNPENYPDLSHWLLKTQLITREEIEEVAQLKAPLHALNLLFNIQQINGFSNSLSQSISTVIQVVNEIKSIHHYDESELKREFSLHHLIQKVLDKHIDFYWVNLIDTKTVLFGKESKIEQLFNLLIHFICAHCKIAAESKINIQSTIHENTTHITLHFPYHMLDNVLLNDIIYSSEHTANSTEKLKLNLILTILQEHNASLKLNAENNLLYCTLFFQNK